MARGDDIENRLLDFAVRVIRLCENLPNNHAGNHMVGQLRHSGTAPAAHDAEARRAESLKDFQHKLIIYFKELNESRIWLKIVMQSQLINENLLDDLFQECDELCRIINASIKTSKRKAYQTL